MQSVTNTKVFEGSSWKFSFRVSTDYPEGCTLRFTFPEGFKTEQTMCSIEQAYGVNPKSRIYHNNRIISCQSVNKRLLSSETQNVTIVNLVNPTFSGYFSSWKIEVLDGDSIVLESKVFSQAIFIGTGDLVTSFTAGNNYKYAKTQYVFYINLKN